MGETKNILKIFHETMSKERDDLLIVIQTGYLLITSLFS